MMIVSESVDELTPGFHYGARHSRAVTGHAVGTDRSCAQKSRVFLRFVHIYGFTFKGGRRVTW